MRCYLNITKMNHNKSDMDLASPLIIHSLGQLVSKQLLDIFQFQEWSHVPGFGGMVTFTLDTENYSINLNWFDYIGYYQGKFSFFIP